MGLLFMCPIMVQPNANVYSYTSIFDVHHLVDFPMTVDNMTVANVSHSASMTHSCMHHSTINFDPHHAACHAL